MEVQKMQAAFSSFSLGRAQPWVVPDIADAFRLDPSEALFSKIAIADVWVTLGSMHGNVLQQSAEFEVGDEYRVIGLQNWLAANSNAPDHRGERISPVQAAYLKRLARSCPVEKLTFMSPCGESVTLLSVTPERGTHRPAYILAPHSFSQALTYSLIDKRAV